MARLTRLNVSGLADEFAGRIVEELDYVREGRVQAQVAAAFADRLPAELAAARAAGVQEPPGGPGEDVRTLVLLPGARRHAERGCIGGPAGVHRPGRDHRGWLYSGTRRAADRRTAATLAAWIRACQAPRATSRMSRMITDSTLRAAMPSGQCQFPTSP
jgi:hypothetical protein